MNDNDIAVRQRGYVFAVVCVFVRLIWQQDQLSWKLCVNVLAGCCLRYMYRMAQKLSRTNAEYFTGWKIDTFDVFSNFSDKSAADLPLKLMWKNFGVDEVGECTGVIISRFCGTLCCWAKPWRKIPVWDIRLGLCGRSRRGESPRQRLSKDMLLRIF